MIDTDGKPRLLFVPVSGPFGMGEYARSVALAQGAQARWPGAAIRFVVSREAPYAARVPFAADLLPSSPTFHSAAVVEIIERWRPDVVVFDNAGRTRQLRAARRFGAAVVYVSARRRQRGKAFRLQWMRLIDEHWIAYPEFTAGGLTALERLKLRLLRRPRVRYLDVILARHGPAPDVGIVARLGCNVGTYVLVVPGGGTGHPGASSGALEFLKAARTLAASGVATVYVGPRPDDTPETPQLVMPGPLPQAELADLMRSARIVVVNGGSTLLQAIASGKACVAAPIAGDQDERIRSCVRAGVAVATLLDAPQIAHETIRLLDDETKLSALEGRAIALGLTDGVATALRALSDLIL